MKTGPAVVLGLAASLTACAATALFAGTLQRRAAARSHEQPPYVAPAATVGVSPAELVREGRRLYLNSCAHCHGPDARGDEGPDLHAIQVSDRRIATVVKLGIKGEMPSFSQKHSDADIARLIAYVRSLE